MATTTQTPAPQSASAGNPYIQASADPGALIRRIYGEHSFSIQILNSVLDALNSGHLDDGGTDPAEHYIWNAVTDYACGRTSPERVKADAADYCNNVENLAKKQAPAEPSPDDPEAYGEHVREQLRRKLSIEARANFRTWAHRANERDLLAIIYVLEIAESIQGSGSEYNASFLTGVASLLGREEAVYCPRKYQPAAERYIERLTAAEGK